MDGWDKFAAALIGGGSSALVSAGLFLFRAGREKEKFDKLQTDMTEVKADVKNLRETHVKKTEYESEMLVVHGRIDRHVSNLERQVTDNQKTLYEIGRSVEYIKGRLEGRNEANQGGQ